jgi:hypothetical protein
VQLDPATAPFGALIDCVRWRQLAEAELRGDGASIERYVMDHLERQIRGVIGFHRLEAYCVRTGRDALRWEDLDAIARELATAHDREVEAIEKIGLQAVHVLLARPVEEERLAEEHDRAVDELHRRGQHNAGWLVDRMRHRQAAPFDYVKHEVQGKEDNSDEAVRQLAHRTNEELAKIESRISFMARGTTLFKKIAPE